MEISNLSTPIDKAASLVTNQKNCSHTYLNSNKGIKDLVAELTLLMRVIEKAAGVKTKEQRKVFLSTCVLSGNKYLHKYVELKLATDQIKNKGGKL